MKYEFTITNGKQSYGEIYYSDGNDAEWLDNHPFNKKEDIEIPFDGLHTVNGKHIIFGVVECLLQSDDCPSWLYCVAKPEDVLRKNIKCIWKKYE